MIENIKLKLKNHRGLLFIAALASIAFLAGIAGAGVARVYLFDDSAGFPFFGDISFADDNYNGSNLIIRGAKNVVVEQNVKVAETISSLNGNLVGIFKKAKTNPGQTKNFLDGYYNLEQPDGFGFIITSDGWILTDAFAKFSDLNTAAKDYVIIAKDKKIYEINKIAKDPLTPYVFIQAKGVRDFSVLKFSEARDINGQAAVALDFSGNGWVTYVVGVENRLALKSPESFSNRLILGDSGGKTIKGAVIASLTGNVIAVAGSEGEIRPIGQFRSAIQSLLKTGQVKRPRLGVSYVDLSNYSSETAKLKKGALIYGTGTSGVVKNSPADLAGLKDGDVILQIEGKEIGETADLAEIIHNYSAGDKIRLSYSRNGENKEAEVTLGEIK